MVIFFLLAKIIYFQSSSLFKTRQFITVSCLPERDFFFYLKLKLFTPPLHSMWNPKYWVLIVTCRRNWSLIKKEAVFFMWFNLLLIWHQESAMCNNLFIYIVTFSSHIHNTINSQKCNNGSYQVFVSIVLNIQIREFLFLFLI